MNAAQQEAPHSMSEVLSDIQDYGDLTLLAEVFDIETDELLRTEFCYVDRDEYAWYGQAKGIPKVDVDLQQMVTLLRPVPDELAFPLATPDLTRAPDDASTDKTMFIKRPAIEDHAEEDAMQMNHRVIVEEVANLELLKQHPHPNIVQYNGCIIRRGRIVGIALTRLEVLMECRFRDDPRELDIEVCVAGVRAGLQHLHELGLAHNDIKPSNIAFTPDDKPVILDFGSCRRFGERLVSGGTPGWMPEPYNMHSAKSTDDFALAKIEAWLREEKAALAARESSLYDSDSSSQSRPDGKKNLWQGLTPMLKLEM